MYLSNYLNKMKQKNKTTWKCNLIYKKSDQIVIEKIYLQIILSLKFIFDILLSCKINLQQNWIRIYECLQNIIHAKCHFDHFYKTTDILK
jgi:hypothetical protein